MRHNEALAKELGLPHVIRQEDGSRDAFEAVFQRFDVDDSKSITEEEFVSVMLGTAQVETRPLALLEHVSA